MVQAIIAAASLIKPLSGALFANKKDPERVATAQANLTKALAGDTVAYAALVAQSTGSATQVGKDAAIKALQAYAQQKNTYLTPPTATPLQQTVGSTLGKIAVDLSQGIQQVGAGVTNSVANKVSAGSGLTVPLNRTQLIALGILAAAIIYFRGR